MFCWQQLLPFTNEQEQPVTAQSNGHEFNRVA